MEGWEELSERGDGAGPPDPTVWVGELEGTDDGEGELVEVWEYDGGEEGEGDGEEEGDGEGDSDSSRD